MVLSQNLAELMAQFPRPGELLWIGVRPARDAPMQIVDTALTDDRQGIVGDRYAGSSGKRQVTLIQAEHLAVLSALLGREINPELLRRNLLIKGINLLALKDRKFQIGGALFQGTGLCQPCFKMETRLGVGGYNAMRGHGGITAQVLQSGVIRVGDLLTAV